MENLLVDPIEKNTQPENFTGGFKEIDENLTNWVKNSEFVNSNKIVELVIEDLEAGGCVDIELCRLDGKETAG